jgi:signal transduction histidine kinase
LLYDRDGSIWVAAATHLFRIRNGVARPYVIPGLRSVRVRTLMRDHSGNLWVGTDGSGLFCLSRGHLLQYDTQHAFANDFVRTILEARDGSIWAGTDGGLAHIVHNTIHNYSISNGLSYFSITALLEDRNGGIWAGTSRGLNHIVNGRIVNDSVVAALRQEQLWSIAEDATDALWFGTNNGLYGWKDYQLVHLTRSQGLAGDRIYQILDDRRGNTWLAGPNSISRLNSAALSHFLPGGHIELNYYIDSHDLNSASLYSGMQPGGAIVPNGDVWLPSNKGAIHIDAGHIIKESKAAVEIAQVTASGQSMPLDREIVLKPGNARLEIAYNAVRLSSQENLRYRYEMEGFESWNEAYTRRIAYYPHLPPGRYRFRVQVYAIDNPSAVSEVSILIIQKPHFYATTWFICCCILALLAIAMLIYRLRLRQMSLRFHAVAEERSRLAREMHDTLIQGCVGVSTLLEAALGVETSNEPLRERLLNCATDQIRVTIEIARNTVWALRNDSTAETDPGTACIELARQLQKESGVAIDVRVHGDAFRLEKPAMHEFMNCVREAAANATAHAHAAHIWIEIDFGEQHLNVEIGDDGCGFQPRETPLLEHFGIIGMQERVRLLRGQLNIDSAPGKGTRVQIRIPRKQRIEKVQ